MPDSGRFDRPGAVLRTVVQGDGAPFVFQHGLGGDRAQVAELLPPDCGRRFTLECRGHGGSEAGPATLFSIAQFADDVLAMADHHRLERFAIGGVSMGAAIALRLAALHPDRISALVLLRPAWLFAPGPDNMHAFAVVAEHLHAFPPAEARRRFADSDTALHLARVAPDNLASLLGFFDRPDPATTAALLARIAADGPGVAATTIAAPALLLGSAEDVLHPLSYAWELAHALPGATFAEVPPKGRDRAAHVAAVRAAIAAFLRRHARG